ncbi:hypothetical protein [Mucilaginibacter sp. SJ]|uniref:hypothetical protein n=1 Tax=Mucilaginibacter sp. SJ TaxID=3029053 RepID=UPI0023A91540|nr:hypothetical protein [Mucilaginibacter sp. SJ]WDZ99233.1 hypothetical protein MusilaSJ_17345 [Mucilaginibacter sp. SJ]
MNNQESKGSRYKLELKDIADLTAAVIALAIIFSLTRNYIYYVLFLHVPIFQYCEAGEIIMLEPTVIWWILNYGTMRVASEIQESQTLKQWERLTFPWLFYLFYGILIYWGYKNVPTLSIIMSYNFFLKHWWLIIGVIVYVLVGLRAKNEGNDYFKMNPLLAILAISIWFGVFDSWASYELLQKTDGHLHQVILTKENRKITLDNRLIYAGRTANYLFVYDAKTKFTRVFKTDDFRTIDYDSEK